MRHLISSFLILFLYLVPLTQADIRHALIVGCDYKGSSLELPSPIKDAKTLASTLKKVGFLDRNIVTLTNPNRGELIRACDRLHKKLKSSGGVGLFYFSGHGSQVDGINYLIPAQATLKFREHLKTEGLAANYVATNMEAANNGVNILILDACRSNPLPSATKKSLASRGLARMDGDGILFCFAAKDGQEALDTGNGSAYTNALISNLTIPNIDVLTMLTKVRKEVKQVTNNRQEPFFYSGLDDPFAFLKTSESAAIAQTSPAIRMGSSKKREPNPRPLSSTLPPVEPREALPVSSRRADTSRQRLVADDMIGKSPGDSQTIGDIDLVWCPPGEFIMGSPKSERYRDKDETVHRVRLTKGFWLAKTELTKAQWMSGNSENSSTYSNSDHPITGRSWNHARKFCDTKNKQAPLPEGWHWNLPTEAQWEYACRSGSTGPYSGFIDSMGWHSGNSGNKVHQVGQKKPNAWGLYDMHGNVWELCLDKYVGDYVISKSLTNDPVVLGVDCHRVHRGGSYLRDAGYSRSATRDKNYQDFTMSPSGLQGDGGFRIGIFRN